MSLFFYRIFLFVYNTGIKAISPWNHKAKLWVQGRKNWKQKMSRQLADDNGKWAMGNEQNATEHFTTHHSPLTIWMHCASLGEFEQGRPLLEKIKLEKPDCKIVLSFFSASGYEAQKNYAGAHIICYLPIDRKKNAKEFINLVNPNLVLWVKYEYWYFYLQEINSRKIKLVLVSGVFRGDQPFFKWYGNLHRKMIGFFTHLFVQNQVSYDLILPLVTYEKLTIAGDTRFDRVIEIAEKFTPIIEIENWIGDTKKVIVAGSTWREDEEELVHYVRLHPEIKFIIAPHQIDADNIEDVMKLFPNAGRWSGTMGNKMQATANRQLPTGNVLLIDTIGLLSRLYHYATITYVGGGFGNDGVHNVLEAAVHAKPVVHGPEFEKYTEAKGLVQCGGAFDIEDALELEKIFDKLFADENFYQKTANASQQFVMQGKGASGKIYDWIISNE